MKSTFLVSQQELATIFGVNRTTVRAWTKQGLPCLEGDKGKPHMYHPGIAMWWRKGRQYAGVLCTSELSALQQIALARAYIEDDEITTDSDAFAGYLAQMGIDDKAARDAFAFAQGVVSGRTATISAVNKNREIISGELLEVSAP